MEPKTENILFPDTCSCGCSAFNPESIKPFYTHQVIELPEIEMDVLHFILNQGVCTQCGNIVKAQLPKEHQTGYGPRISALIAEVSGIQGNSRINHIDETSWFRNGSLNWLWVMVNSTVAYFMIHKNRSKQAFPELIQDWEGILVSDNYGVYAKWVISGKHV